jgi:hypothetical protein
LIGIIIPQRGIIKWGKKENIDNFSFYLLLASSSKLVKSRTSTEPLDLRSVESVLKLDDERLTTSSRLDLHVDGLALSEVLKVKKRNTVITLDAIVISGINKGKSKDTLLLKVGLVDTSKAASDDGNTTKVTRLDSSMLTAATLTIVAVTDNDPLEASSLVGTSSSSDGAELTSDLVPDLVLLTVGIIDSSQEQVVGDVVDVTTELEPWASLADVIGGALATDLDEDGAVDKVLAVPSVEGLERSKTLAAFLEGDGDLGAILSGSLKDVLTRVILEGDSLTHRRSKEPFLTVSTDELVLARIEGETTAESKSSHDGRRADEGVSLLVAISTGDEVTVVGVEDGVLDTRLGVDISTLPLADARTTSIGKNDTTDSAEDVSDTVTLDGGTDLLRARADVELGLDLGAVVQALSADLSSTGEILVAAVGAAADKAHSELVLPATLGKVLGHALERDSTIGGGRATDVGAELAEVELDNLVVNTALIGAEKLAELLGVIGDGNTVGGAEELVLTTVVGEDGAGGTNLSTHVADGGLTSAADLLNTRTVVLDNAVSTTADGELASNPEDDILGRNPWVHLASNVDTDDLGSLKLERKTGHNIDGISTTDTDGDHTHTTSIGGVTVSTNHHTTREGVVLKDELVDDTRARTPVAHAVLGGSTTKEVINLLVGLTGSLKIGLTTLIKSSDKMVSMNGGGDSNVGDARRHELQNSHLGSSILHSHTIRAEIQVALLLDNLLIGVVKVTKENLLSIGKRLVPVLTELGKSLFHLFVLNVRVRIVIAHANLRHLHTNTH